MSSHIAKAMAAWCVAVPLTLVAFASNAQQVQPSAAKAKKPAPAAAKPLAPGRSADGLRIAFPHYSDKARGWHWKEVDPQPEEEEEDESVPLAPPPPPPEMPPAPLPGPKPFSTAWIKEQLPKYMETAIDEPTPQNVSNYLYLQRLALDNAERFSNAYQRVATTDMALDEERSRPTWGPAAGEAVQRAKVAKRQTVKEIGANFGIWFFFRSDCSPCHQIAPILHSFGVLNGLSVLPISVDRADLHTNPWGRFVSDQGHAAKLNVRSTPTLLLVSKTGDYYPITESVIAMDELERRVIEIAAQYQIISEEQYAKTRSTSQQLLPSPATLTSMPAAIADDPAAVRDLLRSQLRKPR